MKFFPTLFFSLAWSASAFAQAPQPATTSPEVHADRKVTFRVAAPKASEVTFTGDWLNGPQKMEKTADGTWSLTVGPLAPSSYIYNFTIDGLAVADPINPKIKLRARTSASIVEVPSGAAAIDELRDVPHGSVDMNWHKSAVLGGETRPVWVYTPPGYTADTAQRYPVCYLFHGTNDRPAGWIDVGNLNLLLDNLIAEKKARPMVVVMPYGHALPYGQRGGQGGRTNTTAFEEYLVNEVMPLAEGKYRLAAGRENRALGGFSMGAEQSLHIFFRHLDLFSWIGAMAPSGYRNFETQHADLVADAKGTNAKINLLYIGCGRQDPGHFNGSQQLVDVLKAKTIQHEWRPVEGMHNYAFVRGQLIEILPRLFQKK
jgi:enterochelin esterase family protein